LTRAAITSYLGATHLGGGRTLFRVWAPEAERVDVHMVEPRERLHPLSPTARGYHEGIVEDVPPGTLYRYRLDQKEAWPDPASRSQPQGVHGPSEVTDREFDWSDQAWHGVPLKDFILYELHTGSFSEAGTFDGVIAHLPDLVDLGITAIELMPVGEFPGQRNWGYDGVFPFAAQSSYGGPRGLKRLVDACHRLKMAVVLDVVYNHLGPEGNVLGRFGPYFTDRYRTPWGEAVNFDGAGSDEVRHYFIANALQWLEEFHIDALRLDAVHAIVDETPFKFLEELAVTVRERVHRRVYLMPESCANDARLVRPRDLGGYGLDCLWNDDFHHALHTLLTGETNGYYQDYGRLAHLEKAVREGFCYSGEYSVFRGRRHGVSSRDLPAERFVVFAQNHDQIGNRLEGDRLNRKADLERVKLAASVVLLSPYLPLIFMGEEYGETAPFPYFVSHSDPALIDAVRRGRKEEFQAFGWEKEPPDPQDPETFRSARLHRELRARAPHGTLFSFYRQLIQLRRELFSRRSKDRMKVVDDENLGILQIRDWSMGPAPSQLLTLFHFGETEATLTVNLLRGGWRKRLDSAAIDWRGPGTTLPGILRTEGSSPLSMTPWSAALYEWDPNLENEPEA
jgi:maltooligosyltrehalose trehalohydrolase